MSSASCQLTPSGYLDCAPQEARRLLNKVRLIDVREPHEFHGELGHIPGAELVPLATVELSASSWDKSEPVMLVCRSGKRSSIAAALLCKLGFTEVHNLQGGMLAWAAHR